MKPLHFILFLVTLPVLVSFGHDLYLFYVAQGEQLSTDLITKIYTEDRPGRSFDLAALGYIWTQYAPDSYKLMSESYEPAEWAQIQEILKLKATLVFAAIAAAVYALALVFKALVYIKDSSGRVGKSKRVKMR